MSAIAVTVRRGGLVEAVHRVHAVVVEDGRITESAGDPGFVTFYRSSSKPLQALPLARERDDVTEVELAIACASHRAEPPQLEAARSLLERAPATEADLELGPQEGRGPSLLSHNCSGKHAGFLAVCRARGWPIEGYRLASHPLQQLLLGEIAAAADLDEGEVGDRGGRLRRSHVRHDASSGWRTRSRASPELEGGGRIVAAMTAHPELIGYERGATDTDLMRLRPGWIAKGGAEGLICAATPEGVGIALKVEDGNMRALRPALAAFLGLGDDFGAVPVLNSRGERVGEVGT